MATLLISCVPIKNKYTTYAVVCITIPGLTFVPVPVAIPTNCTKNVTSNVQADAKIISGNVSPTNWYHCGLLHIIIGIIIIRDIIASNNILRNWKLKLKVFWWVCIFVTLYNRSRWLYDKKRMPYIIRNRFWKEKNNHSKSEMMVLSRC